MSVVCITGMHRSGTSMVARLLNLCGLYLGEESDLLPPAVENPEGFWENYRFYRVNEGILSAFEGAWDCPPVLEQEWLSSPALDPLRAEAAQYIAQISSHEHWGWKDPRNSLSLPFWRQLVPGLKVIVCVRHPEEVAASLAKRGSASRRFSMRLWQSYTEPLVRDLEGMDRLVTHYDAYFQNPEAELTRLLEFLGMKVPAEQVREACRSVSQNLKHNRANAPIEDFPAVQALYASLCSQAGPVYHPGARRGTQQKPPVRAAAAGQDAAEPQGSGNSKLIKDLHSQIFEGLEKVRILEDRLQQADKQIQEQTDRIRGLELQVPGGPDPFLRWVVGSLRRMEGLPSRMKRMLSRMRR